ncbi:UNVERIFIED_CONTAM: hypothetical protein Slati_1207100 [Sesamum latifolium]|uniref:Bet v I/Major latex protein domain-containing protein n=1 Tax=Sesamum latifolium TaxID=2727402 RepID=A0AAW2XDU0_9LAMI
MEVKVPASEAWKLYGSLLLAKVVVEALPDRFSKVEVVEGDGSAGTILHIFLAPGTAGPASYKEKYTVVDDETREGGGVGGGRVFGSGVYTLQGTGRGDGEGGEDEGGVRRARDDRV